MARLPQISYGGVSQANLQGPETEVRKSSQRIALVNQAQQGAERIADAHTEYKFNKAVSSYADEMSKFRQEAAKERVVGAEKIIAWGLDDVIDVSGREGDKFFRSEWYPEALKRVEEKARAKHGETLNGKSRLEFNQTASESANRMMEREIEIAAEESFKELQAMKEADAADAIQAGQYETAVSIVAGMDVPDSVKREMESNIVLMRDENKIRDEIQTLNSPSELTSFAEYLRTPDATTRFQLNEEQLDQMAARADAKAKGIIDDAKIGQEKSNAAYAAATIAELDRRMMSGQLDSESWQQAIDAAEARGDKATVTSLISSRNNWYSSSGAGMFAMPGHENVDMLEARRLMDPAELVDVRLNMERSQYTKPQYEELLDRQVAIKNAKATVPKGTPPAILTSAYNRAMGTSDLLILNETNDKSGERRKDRAAAKAAYVDLYTAEEMNLGRPLTAQEAQRVADHIAIPFAIETYNKGFFSDDRGTAIDQIIEESDKASENDKAKVRVQVAELMAEIPENTDRAGIVKAYYDKFGK